jgi:hypothetical protein
MEAGMGEKEYSNKSIKLTAAVYATKPEVLAYVREHGELPNEIYNGGLHIAMRVIIERRGIDLELTEKEKLIYDAIMQEGRMPGGDVRLVEDVKIK